MLARRTTATSSADNPGRSQHGYRQAAGLKARALGAWSCRDVGADHAVDYLIGDGVYSIPTYQRGGTWSLDGTSLTIHETKNYGDDLLDATTTIHLTSADQPTGATISYAANYSSGSSDQAEGGAHDGETVVVHLQHGSALNTGTDDVTRHP